MSWEICSSRSSVASVGAEFMVLILRLLPSSQIEKRDQEPGQDDDDQEQP